jgi:hypothetical protein
MRRESPATSIVNGLAAGAAGTTALNAVTYLDMVLQGRPASTTPEQTVRTAEEATGIELAADGPDGETATNRRSALGALLGIAAGLCTGAVYGLARPRLGRLPLTVLGTGVGLAANVATTGPMALAGITDPRDWSASSWLSDLVPHVAYGLVTAAVLDRLDAGGRADGRRGPDPTGAVGRTARGYVSGVERSSGCRT